jgi:hypothetical protein
VVYDKQLIVVNEAVGNVTYEHIPTATYLRQPGPRYQTALTMLTPSSIVMFGTLNSVCCLYSFIYR